MRERVLRVIVPGRRRVSIAVVAAVLAALGHTRTGAQSCPLFSDPVGYAAGSQPGPVALGDFNGDATLDIAVANHGSNTVSILLGNGDGTFAAAVNYAAGSSVASVAIGDLDGDAKLDLAVANHGSDTVSILLGQGDGTFAAAVDYGVGDGPNSVAIGDLNGDGKLDLAVAESGLFSNHVSILLGNGNGTFASDIQYASGPNEEDFVTIGDLNADGKPDLVLVNGAHINSVAIALGHGDGTFAAPHNYNPNGRLVGLASAAIGDLNGDGKYDLAVADSSGSVVWVLPGNGDGTFNTGTSHAVDSGSFSVAIGDLNGDGKPDLATANQLSQPGDVSILLGGGDGTFAPRANYASGSQPWAIAMGDFNADGKPDLVVANRNANTVTVLLRTSTCSPPTIIAPSITSQPASLIVHAGSTVTWSATASGTPAPTIQWQFRSNNSVAAWNDIALARSTSYTFTAAAGDSGRQFRAVFTNAGGVTTTTPAGLTVTSDQPFVGDLDGDGLSDLIVWRPNTGWWFALTSTSGYDTQASLAVQWGSQAYGDIPLLGDVDGDGKADFIVWRASTGTWYWLTSSTGYNPAMAGNRQWGNAGNAVLGDIPLVGDLDGDGKMDLIIWRASTGTWFWLTSSSGYSSAAQGQKQWGDNGLGDVPILGDLDGDGKSDLTVWRASTGTWYWLTSSSDYNYAAQGQRQWGAQGDTPIAAAFDTDGRADLTVWRPSNATWFWLTSSSAYDYTMAGSRVWGSAVQ